MNNVWLILRSKDNKFFEKVQGREIIETDEKLEAYKFMTVDEIKLSIDRMDKEMLKKFIDRKYMVVKVTRIRKDGGE